MTSDTIWQIVRYALLALGGFFINKGLITSDQLTAIIGALGTLFTAGWGIYVKYGTRATTSDAAMRSDVPTVSAATGIVSL
ncbi:MAG: hypothetical protein EKK40_15690 [Bradyrhizobiaceae bacterium]|nr:MAG: hypothetical protein EKK40_15690 [Bradyrhizobiaceae bacterium]